MTPLHNPDPLRVRQAAAAAIARLEAGELRLLARFGEERAARSLAVLDSSFNPPTIGHAAMVRDLAEGGIADRALLLLSLNNADKAPVPAPFADRLAMMAVLARELAPIIPCAIGITRAALFIDKARLLRRLHGPEAELRLLLGDDTLLRLFAPRYYNDDSEERDAAITELTALARLVSFRRGSIDAALLAAFLQGPAAPFRHALELRPAPCQGRPVSSQRARREIQRNRQTDLLSPAVLVLARPLYAEDEKSS